MAEDKNVLGMSDEDFLKENPPEVKEKESTEDTSNEEDKTKEESSEETAQESEESKEDNKTEEEDHDKEDDQSQSTENEEENNSDNTETQDTDTKTTEPEKKSIKSSGSIDKSKETIESTGSVDYEAFYKKVMAPFKANGKMITLRSPEEAIQLMQQGANFTKKMQAIAPHRKLLIMLENNGLLDESKINYLIDLDKKNPEAIKKLVKDAGIDPIDIDTQAENKYQPSNYRVSDDEANFINILDDLKQNQEGLETLRVINSWDATSKEAIFKDPSIMQTIHTQRENGVFQKISEEIERQKILGNINVNVPFLVAYKQVGDLLVKQNQGKLQRQPLDVRKAVPKSLVTNSDKVKAAAPTRSNKNKVEKFINPLSMSDDDFLKQFENRL
jgi:hypothetical protein